MRHAGPATVLPAVGVELSHLAPREYPADAAAARKLPLWEGYTTSGTDLCELPGVADVRAHVLQADSAVMFIVSADAKDQTLVVAHAASMADAEAVSAARGCAVDRSVTCALTALPVRRRAQWLGLLKALGWDLCTAPTMSADGQISEDDVLAPADRALHLPLEVASEIVRVVKGEGLPAPSAIASGGWVADAGLPRSCSPAALSTCAGPVVLWAPAAHAAGQGFQQSPPRVAANLVAYAAAQLERTKNLEAVVPVVPQAAPGNAHWAR